MSVWAYESMMCYFSCLLLFHRQGCDGRRKNCSLVDQALAVQQFDPSWTGAIEPYSHPVLHHCKSNGRRATPLPGTRGSPLCLDKARFPTSLLRRADLGWNYPAFIELAFLKQLSKDSTHLKLPVAFWTSFPCLCFTHFNFRNPWPKEAWSGPCMCPHPGAPLPRRGVGAAQHHPSQRALCASLHGHTMLLPCMGREPSFSVASNEVIRPGAHPCSQLGVRDGLGSSHLWQVQVSAPSSRSTYCTVLHSCGSAAALARLCPVLYRQGEAAKGSASAHQAPQAPICSAGATTPAQRWS